MRDRNLNTSLNEVDIEESLYLTYEGSKHDRVQVRPKRFRRLYLTYEGSKHIPFSSSNNSIVVCILPMRDRNMLSSSAKAWYIHPFVSYLWGIETLLNEFSHVFDILFCILPMRDRNKLEGHSAPLFYFVCILPMRDRNTNSAKQYGAHRWCLYLTYEGSKLQ